MNNLFRITPPSVHPMLFPIKKIAYIRKLLTRREIKIGLILQRSTKFEDIFNIFYMFNYKFLSSYRGETNSLYY